MAKDDNTFENAGPFGRELASSLYTEVEKAIEGMPESSGRQRAAIARIVANDLYDYADAEEGVE